MHRQRVVRVGVEGLRFESIHYTALPGEEARLHGHSFRVDIAVEGVVEGDGVLIDFRVMRSIVEKALEEWNEAIILPRESRARIEGPFTVRIKVIDGAATTENIACTLLDEVRGELLKASNGRVKRLILRVWESYDRYAECIEEATASPQDRTSGD